jgi:hypothetical protein
MRIRPLAVLTAGVLCALAVTTNALGDGGPGPGVVQGWDGVTNGKERFVAVPSTGWTTIQAVQRNGGRIVRWLNVEGSWGIPLVAFDGAREALRPDGRTLVIASPTSRTLNGRSSFALVDMKKMRVLDRVDLRGSFSFDALSPDQRYLYLVQYVSEVNLNRYRVRAYDLKAGRLLKRIVSDRRSWETTMEGWPISRASRGGWAYTLYGGGVKPFIHALDTRNVEAVCIDLPWKASPKRIYEWRLRFDGEKLVVRSRHGRPLVTLDRLP